MSSDSRYGRFGVSEYYEMSLIEALRAGVPFISIVTPDPVVAIAEFTAALNEKRKAIGWDLISGVRPLNQAAARLSLPADTANDPLRFLEAVGALCKNRTLSDTVLFVQNFSAVLEAVGFPARQWLYNLRDLLKSTGCAFVIVERAANIPPDISPDFIFIDHPLPSAAQITEMMKQIVSAYQVQATDDDLARCADILAGLSLFAAEQAFALSVVNPKRQVNFELLWELKCRQVSQTPGISVWQGKERFEQLGGLENVKRYCRAKLSGRKKYGAVVFIDEIEKALAGATAGTADSSGVSQGILQTLLVYMQDNEVSGMLFLGHPGTGKSAIAKALGNEGGIPTIVLDFGALKDSLVGATERRVREALKVVSAISNRRPLFVATCNQITSLPPELRRRFTGGTFFFDLPTAEERESIWAYYLKKYSIDGQKPYDEGWTGAEIKACVEGAWERNCSLLEAAEYIVPISRADPRKVAELQQGADNRYISASFSGVYRMPTNSGRRLEYD